MPFWHYTQVTHSAAHFLCAFFGRRTCAGRRWRNSWLQFRKRLIINSRSCPCISHVPVTRVMAMSALIVFSANTAILIPTSRMKSVTSYPCTDLKKKKKGSLSFCFFSNVSIFHSTSVLYNIMSNTFIPIEYKQRLRSAARIGRDFQQCNRYDCPALSETSSSY